MNSTQSQPEPAELEELAEAAGVPEAEAAEAAGAEDRSLRLPAHGTTVTAEDLRVRLVLAADFDGKTVIDASAVESIGQAVLQLLVAARREADRTGQSFSIANPSPAFLDRVTRCRLAGAIGLTPATGDAA